MYWKHYRLVVYWQVAVVENLISVQTNYFTFSEQRQQLCLGNHTKLQIFYNTETCCHLTVHLLVLRSCWLNMLYDQRFMLPPANQSAKNKEKNKKGTGTPQRHSSSSCLFCFIYANYSICPVACQNMRGWLHDDFVEE